MFTKIFPICILFFISCSSQKPFIITKIADEKKVRSTTIVSEKNSEIKKDTLKDKIVFQDTIKSQKSDLVETSSIFKDTSMKFKDYDGIIKSMKENGNEDQDTIPKKKPLNLGNVQVLKATTTVRVTKDIVFAYIEKYKEISKNEMLKFRIPASITLAQGILESGAGTGPLSLQANNHFGIKCHEGWTGESVRYDDDVPDECFRKYDNSSKSFEDHSSFLYTRPWYNKLFKLKQDDYKGWAKGLKEAGYATDIKYPQKLIAIIESYKLYEYDLEVLGIETEDTNREVTNQVPEKVIDSQVINQNLDDTYTVQPKEGLYSIAKKFNLTVEQLKKLNGLTDNNISIGQILKIK